MLVTGFGNGSMRRKTRAPRPVPPELRRTLHQTPADPIPFPNPVGHGCRVASKGGGWGAQHTRRPLPAARYPDSSDHEAFA
jgi:hypothetical protein